MRQHSLTVSILEFIGITVVSLMVLTGTVSAQNQSGSDLTITKYVSENQEIRLADADEWSFTIDGQTITTNQQGRAEFNRLLDGEYVISEAGVNGYSLLSVSGDCELVDGEISLTIASNNEPVPLTCVVTNELNPPAYVRLQKVVINDDEGQLTAEDFELLLNGQAALQNQNIEILSGVSYTVDELPVDGYYLESIICSPLDDGEYFIQDETSSIEASKGGSIFIAEPYQTFECIITNNDEGPGQQPETPQLTVVLGDRTGTQVLAETGIPALATSLIGLGLAVSALSIIRKD